MRFTAMYEGIRKPRATTRLRKSFNGFRRERKNGFFPSWTSFPITFVTSREERVLSLNKKREDGVVVRERMKKRPTCKNTNTDKSTNGDNRHSKLFQILSRL